MAQNFTVNYDINVLSQDAVTAINSFAQATKKLNQAMQPFRKLNTSISNMQNNLTKLNAKTYTVKLETSKAVNNVNKLIGSIRRLKAEAKGAGVNLGSITAGGAVGSGTATRNTGSRSGNAATGTRNKPTATSRNIITRNMPKNLGYKLLGPTPLDVGGIMGVDMLKGMGIAYGIAGIGSLISNSVKDYTEYNNIMKTAENILGAHDKRADFKERFAAMEKQVRNVGVQTKFTAPQVADASKFLAMAGFDVDAINKSIAPIADIALVGDTDLGETADVVTNIMTGYNISPEKVRKAADIMTMTFTKSNTTLMEIAEAYKYSASLLSAGDVPFEEATAAMGILGNAGIKGSQAGTTMRTIMANIVNPTKKQAAAWKRIGVSRTDKNGNMRDVVDIFEDLNKKDLSLSDYYQIFHKTAAQGAVSLANDVKGWNEIIKENLMSDGLAKELADEKKNTIQGLWAQLTSMFTENGIQAFDEIQQPIKDFLNNIISWLKTSEAKNFIKDTAKDLLDFAKSILQVTRDILAFYKVFRSAIWWFVELQMKIWPLLGVARIGKAFILAGSGVAKFASSVGLLATNIRLLNFKKNGLGALTSVLNGAANIGDMTYIGNGRVAVGNQGRITTKAAADRYNAIYGKRTVSPIANTATSLIGGYLGWNVGSQIGEDITGGSPIGSVIGSAIGAGIGSISASVIAPWIMKSVLPFFVSGPVGWAVGIGTVLAAGGAYFLKYKSDVEDAIEANQQYLSSIASINGMSLSEHATTTDKYLNIVYNKQMDVNQAIGEHINLMREQLGIMDEATKKYSDKTLGETHGEIIENAAKPFKWSLFRNTDDMKKAATSSLILPDGFVDYQGSPRSQEYLDRNGRAYTQWSFNGRLFPETDNGYQRLAAARLLYGLARDTSEGTPLQKARDSYNKRALASASLEDFDAVIKDTNNARIKTYLKSTKEWTMQDLENKPESEWRRSYDYVNSYNTTLKNMFDIANPLASANAQMLSDFKEILSKLDTDDISDNLLSKFLLHSGIPIFDETKFGKFASDEFMKQFGWYNGKWNAGTYQFFNVETGKMETINVTAEEARNAFLLFHQQIIDLTNKLNPKVRSYFNTFLDNPIWGYGGTENGSNGRVTVDDGVEYNWDSKDQKWKLSPKSKKVSVIIEYSNEEMQKKLKQQKGGTGTGRNGRAGNGSITPATHNTKGASQADYKQHYNNNTAAPKQVIVKIENLMNVKSIDLSKKDNKEVIDNVKSQLTQALVDVVHDFDETWHG